MLAATNDVRSSDDGESSLLIALLELYRMPGTYVGALAKAGDLSHSSSGEDESIDDDDDDDEVLLSS